MTSACGGISINALMGDETHGGYTSLVDYLEQNHFYELMIFCCILRHNIMELAHFICKLLSCSTQDDKER